MLPYVYKLTCTRIVSACKFNDVDEAFEDQSLVK